MKNTLLKRFLYAACIPLAVVACTGDDDEVPGAATVDFAGVGSAYYESDGTGSIVLPLRNGDANDISALDVEFGGNAVEGEDFTFDGISAEGVTLTILDDSQFESYESIVVRLTSPTLSLTGNNEHKVSILSNCEDSEGLGVDYFEGDYEAYERYGPDSSDWYGPYTIHLIQDEEDPNTYHFDNLYDSGCDAYMVFDMVAGTVYFPDQEPCGVPLTASSGAFSGIDPCTNGAVLMIDLDFDGGPWTYSFRKLE